MNKNIQKLNLLSNDDLKFKNKDFLIKLIELYNFINKEEFLSNIKKKIQKEDSIQNTIIEIRLNSLFMEDSKITYSSKENKNIFTIYSYDGNDKTKPYKMIYWKKKDYTNSQIEDLIFNISKENFLEFWILVENRWVKVKEEKSKAIVLLIAHIREHDLEKFKLL